MLDPDLLVALAGIAGVFVGFGALISGTSGPNDLWLVRSIVTQGLMVIAAALVPIPIAAYGVTGHQLWVVCALAVLALDWAVILFLHSRREYMAFQILQGRGTRVAIGIAALLLEVPFQGALILIVLGQPPDVDRALYLTAVILALFQAAALLVILVYSRGRPASA
jgi:hypothetical protein